MEQETCIRVIKGVPTVCKKPPGRPRKEQWEKLTCAYSLCGKPFTAPPYRKARFCSQSCHLAFERTQRWNVEFARQRKQRYKPVEIVKLYTERKLSTVKIARMLRAADPQVIRQILLNQGVELRETSDYSAKICHIKGCGKPVKKLHHATNGCDYGTRCAEHLKQHRKKVCRESADKFRKKHPGELARRCAMYAQKLKAMTFEELYQLIKEKPCQRKKEELLRKLRKLNNQGNSREAIRLALTAFPMRPQ